MEKIIEDLFSSIETYAQSRDLPQTAAALPVLKEILGRGNSSEYVLRRRRTQLQHALQTTEMLMDLHLVLPSAEEDTLLAAVILHVCPESITAEDIARRGMSPEVCEVINLMRAERDGTEKEQRESHQRICENRLALLAALADRGNRMQQLYLSSTWNAHRCIDETKACYYPMAIYGKEHYHELLGPISVLLEKIRSLVEVSEILISRYETREAELTQDILTLREENATMKGLIDKYRSEEA